MSVNAISNGDFKVDFLESRAPDKIMLHQIFFLIFLTYTHPLLGRTTNSCPSCIIPCTTEVTNPFLYSRCIFWYSDGRTADPFVAESSYAGCNFEIQLGDRSSYTLHFALLSQSLVAILSLVSSPVSPSRIAFENFAIVASNAMHVSRSISHARQKDWA